MLSVGAIIWALVSALFLVQAVTSLIVGVIYLAGAAFSKVPRDLNGKAAATSFAQAILFAVLFFGGNLLTSYYFVYASWNAVTIAALIVFLGAVVFTLPQVWRKFSVARLSAWTRPEKW